MRAILADSGPRFDAAYPDPVANGREALIRVRLAGVCNTDLELLQGYMDYRGVLGHEFVGEVVQTEDSAWIGKRVVGDINAACYKCETCLAGRHTHCPHRTTLGIYARDGAFADYLLLPQANLYAVPDGVPDEMAVFAEPLAAACEILDQVHVSSADRVVVLGDGRLGLLVAAVLRLTGADLLLVGRHEEKLAVARGWGVTTAVADEAASDRQADIVVECTGSNAGFGAAYRWLRPRGTLVLKSTYRERLTFDVSALVVDEISIIGSRCGPFAPALRMLESGLVDPAPLISAIFPLEDGVEALAHAASPETLKVVRRV
jgi:alcohol dehydrogenase